MARRWQCTCTGDPQRDPCPVCSRRIELAEFREPEDDTAAAERFYEKDLDRIGGSL
jgi:hypothetical protein